MPPHETTERRPRILCVEDDPDVREMMQGILELEGFEVVVVPRALEALTILASQPFDLIITDQMLPDETGGWLLCQARARGIVTRAVIVTAQPQPDRIPRPHDVPVFQKPLDFDRFVSRLRALTGERGEKRYS